MNLQSLNGDSISLEPTGYQFPEFTPIPGDLDSEWMMIRGAAQKGGQHWTFHEPCLYVLEAIGFGSWLVKAASGAVPITSRKETSGVKHFWPSIYFLEPNLGFSVAELDGDLITIRAHLSFECKPPDDPSAKSLGVYQYFIAITLGISELSAAGEDWLQEMAPFPRRNLPDTISDRRR